MTANFTLPTPYSILSDYLAAIENPAHDDIYDLIRNHLDTPHEADPADYPSMTTGGIRLHIFNRIVALLIEMNTDEFQRDELSTLAMDLSLCPMHFCDWAACFDDDDDECAAIRAVFPHSHDT